MVALVAAWLLAAGPDLRADLFLRSEVRASHLAPTQLQSISRLSAEVQPVGAVALEAREWRLRLTYAPRLWMPDLHYGRLDVDHQVDVRGEASPTPALSMALTGTASRGVLDPLTDMWTSIAPRGTSTTTLTASDPLFYQSIRGAVDGLYRLDASGGIAGSAYVGFSEGDAAHRKTLPPQRSLGGALGFDKAVDARDWLRAQVNATVIRTFSGGIDPNSGGLYPDTESGYVAGDATWRRRLSVNFTGLLGAGASYVRQTSTFWDPINGWAPMLAVGLDLASDRPGPTLRSAIRYAPEVDRVTGRARRVVTGSSVFDWPVSVETSLSAGLQISVMNALDPSTLALEVRVSRRLGDRLSLRAGARTRRQTAIQQVDDITGQVTRAQGNYMESMGFLALDWDAIRTTRGAPPVGAK